MTALISEYAGQWRPIPRWARFLINLGFTWPVGTLRPRRIAIVSMPCDSAAAGIVALGAHTRDLCDPSANAIDGHFDSLVRYAQQFLNSCLPCTKRCVPEQANCGHIVEATGRIRSIGAPRRLYSIASVSAKEERHISFTPDRQRADGHDNGTITIYPSAAMKYYVDGDPQAVAAEFGGELPGEAYSQIVEGAKIVPENLRSSFSGFCLSGRVGGERQTKDMFASIRFRCLDGDHDLLDLLSVHGWGASSVSRMTFFNSRTEKFDRRGSPPGLVIADGAAAFLRVLGRTEFQRSDVIGIVHRTMERDELEEIGAKLLGMRQWYDEDREMQVQLADAPRGISLAVFARRRA